MKSKGRVTYWAAREIGKGELPMLCFKVMSEDLVPDLQRIIDQQNTLSIEDAGTPSLELVRVEITPV